MATKLTLLFSIVIVLSQTVSAASTIKPTTNHDHVNTENIEPTSPKKNRLDVILDNGEQEVAYSGVTSDTPNLNDPTIVENDEQETTQSGVSTDDPFSNDPTTTDEFGDNDDTFPSDEEKIPECLSSGGLFPNWHDDTCTSYVECQDFVPTLHTCPDGDVFSAIQRKCVPMTLFSCHVTNEALKVASDAFSLFRESIPTNLDHRVKRSTEKVVDGTHGKKNGTVVEMVLPSTLCELISWNTDFFETNMNNLIRINANCPKGSYCKTPTLSFRCERPEDVDSDQDESESSDEY